MAKTRRHEVVEISEERARRIAHACQSVEATLSMLAPNDADAVIVVEMIFGLVLTNFSNDTTVAALINKMTVGAREFYENNKDKQASDMAH